MLKLYAISMKYQWKSIENQLIFNRNFSKIPMEIHWKSNLNLNEILIKNYLKSG